MSTKRTALIFLQTALLATAWTLPMQAAPNAQQQQLKPVLQAIDPSQAQEAPVEQEQQPAQQEPAPNPGLQQLIPEFGKPDPVVPPSMARPMPPGPGFASGYAPVQPQPFETLQAPNAPDDPRIATLEQAAFGSTYPEHDADDRIEHLEREAFGKIFPGDTESRIQRLQAKYGPVGAFAGQPNRPPAYQPVTTQTQYRPQPPQYQPQNWQQPPPQQPTPQQAYMPPQQTQRYQPPQQQPPPSIPAQPYRQPQQAWQQPPQQPAYQPPPSIPSQPYQPPQQAWQQQPPQQPAYQPPQQMPPYSVATSAPPSIPQGPVTMSSFNRSQQQPPAQQQPTQQQQQPAQPVQQQPQALENMPYDKKAGDYSQQMLRLGGSFARWTNFPVRVHIPMNTPENWRVSVESAVKKWSQYLPTVIAPPSEPADIEIGWINHLMPRQLGITNLEIFNGHPRVTVYLLRPNYYPPDVPETTLQRVAVHHMGHALGLFGHSPSPGDVMFALDTPTKSAPPKNPTISQRDVNTLRRIYEASPLPDGFQSPQPISWP